MQNEMIKKGSQLNFRYVFMEIYRKGFFNYHPVPTISVSHRLLYGGNSSAVVTEMILSFWTDRSGQTY